LQFSDKPNDLFTLMLHSSAEQRRRNDEKAKRKKSTSRKGVEVRKGQTTAHVRVDIGDGVIVTSSITNEAVDDLGLAQGDDVFAVIKASDVMIGK